MASSASLQGDQRGPIPTPGPDRAAACAGSVLGSVSETVARLRHGRPLHTTGAVCNGVLTRTGGRSGIDWVDGTGEDDVIVRLSRGGGLPSFLPDVQGLAVRAGDVDLLLAVTGRAVLGRHVLRPRRTPGGAYTSLLPFRTARGPVLLAALPSGRRLPAAWPEAAADLAAEPWQLRLAWADVLGPWIVFGSLVVGGPLTARTDEPIRFDPRRTPPGLDTYPWVDLLRGPAYVRARRGYPDAVTLAPDPERAADDPLLETP